MGRALTCQRNDSMTRWTTPRRLLTVSDADGTDGAPKATVDSRAGFTPPQHPRRRSRAGFQPGRVGDDAHQSMDALMYSWRCCWYSRQFEFSTSRKSTAGVAAIIPGDAGGARVPDGDLAQASGRSFDCAGVEMHVPDLFVFGGIRLLAVRGSILMAIELVASFVPQEPDNVLCRRCRERGQRREAASVWWYSAPY